MSGAKRHRLHHTFLELLGSWARLAAVTLFVITFLAQPFQIPTGSMEPTMLVGDFVLANKQVFAPAGRWRWLLPYREPERDSLVIFHFPVDHRRLLVKRVVGVPGEAIRLHEGRVWVNGSPVAEPFATFGRQGRSHYKDEFPSLLEADPEVQASWWMELRERIRNRSLPVPKRVYFALGDNRENSVDSRFWGWVPREGIVGEPMLVSISLNRSERGRKAVRWRRSLRVLR